MPLVPIEPVENLLGSVKAFASMRNGATYPCCSAEVIYANSSPMRTRASIRSGGHSGILSIPRSTDLSTMERSLVRLQMEDCSQVLRAIV